MVSHDFCASEQTFHVNWSFSHLESFNNTLILKQYFFLIRRD